jgi:hypothetical protein
VVLLEVNVTTPVVALSVQVPSAVVTIETHVLGVDCRKRHVDEVVNATELVDNPLTRSKVVNCMDWFGPGWLTNDCGVAAMVVGVMVGVMVLDAY